MGMVRFATIGTSKICERFLDALAGEPRAALASCYSRSGQKAREFADAHGAGLAFDSLEELAICPEVDAVYVSSPNALHVSQAKALVAAGKHVLVEKSLGSNEREAAELFRAADETGVVAMEAMRNLHTPGFTAIEREVAALGQVRLAQMSFSKVTSRIARLRAGERLNIFDPRMAAGALCDMGVYTVAPAVALFGRPERVAACGVTTRVPGTADDDQFNIIDLAGSISLGYPEAAVALSYGKLSDDQLSCQVQGEKATLVWDHVEAPENLRVFDHEDKGMVFRQEAREGRPVEVAPCPANDMACEIADFVDAVLGERGTAQMVARFRQVTLDTAHVMDEARRQLGVTFPADLA
ncbi:Gfo/Idh/MocA family protein [Paratractidigestivibacter faecalis]|uniref:Gfo/Idh/MocA family protein n=1 Tax=Paratractidigestivibacter faecalis TaxID=2292441 RepID=UPI003AB494C9